MHVDALSQSVAYVNELPFEREMEFRQLNDPRIKEISNLLEYKDSEKFALINGSVQSSARTAYFDRFSAGSA